MCVVCVCVWRESRIVGLISIERKERCEMCLTSLFSGACSILRLARNYPKQELGSLDIEHYRRRHMSQSN